MAGMDASHLAISALCLASFVAFVCCGKTTEGAALQQGGHPPPRHRPAVRVRDQGWVRGLRAKDGQYDAFLGIPYADASDPSNRFKSPLPIPTWEGLKDANNDEITCLQNTHNAGAIGQEDCLVANVYAPTRASPAAPVPVMVWIHGGGFKVGSGSRVYYGPQNLVKHDVVLVTFNYRLGSLGFLCVREEDAPGNAGLKDMVQALKWVKKNINEFGGDAENVTIFGQSSGASAVEYLMLSPMAKGLFNRAISQSGSAFSPWAITRNPIEKATILGRSLGIENVTMTELVKVLKTLPGHVIVNATIALESLDMTLPLCPCIEKADNAKGETFLSQSPYDIIMSGKYNKVDYISGFNKDDGLIIAEYINDPFLEDVNSNFSNFLPSDIKFSSAEEMSKLTLEVKRFYFGEKVINRDTVDIFKDYATDVLYLNRIIWSINAHANSSNASVYFYEFAYDGGFPFLKKRLNIQDTPGVCHADELGYLFVQGKRRNVAAKDELMIDRITTMWTNFAKYGNPVPSVTSLLPIAWPPIKNGTLDYLVVDYVMELNKDPHSDRMAFWDNIYKDHTKL